MPDGLYHAAGRMLIAFGKLDVMIESQIWLHHLSVFVATAPDPENVTSEQFDASPLPGEGRFSYRLKRLRQIHVEITGNDLEHMSALDKWLAKVRLYEPLRSILAHGMLALRLSTGSRVVFHSFGQAQIPNGERPMLLQETTIEKILAAAKGLEGMSDALIGLGARLRAEA